jgi:calcineurin-like phosphoesterase family protein
MTIWFTSDHHFGHANIIKYCNRPYNSVAHMNALMEAAWNLVVEQGDTVYYLGDFAMHPDMVTEILPRLKGTKILIAGNHDKCHGGATKWVEHYLTAGFESVQKHLDMEIAGENVLLHHFPYRHDSDPAQKHFGSRPVDKGRWLVHGHVHDRWKVSKKQINVSVEPWNFEPVSLEALAAIIQQGPVETGLDTGTSYEE